MSQWDKLVAVWDKTVAVRQICRSEIKICDVILLSKAIMLKWDKFIKVRQVHHSGTSVSQSDKYINKRQVCHNKTILSKLSHRVSAGTPQRKIKKKNISPTNDH